MLTKDEPVRIHLDGLLSSLRTAPRRRYPVCKAA